MQKRERNKKRERGKERGLDNGRLNKDEMVREGRTEKRGDQDREDRKHRRDGERAKVRLINILGTVWWCGPHGAGPPQDC